MLEVSERANITPDEIVSVEWIMADGLVDEAELFVPYDIQVLIVFLLVLFRVELQLATPHRHVFGQGEVGKVLEDVISEVGVRLAVSFEDRKHLIVGEYNKPAGNLREEVLHPLDVLAVRMLGLEHVVGGDNGGFSYYS